MDTQPDLFDQCRPETPSVDDKAVLRAHLTAAGWQTRRDLVTALGWSERKVRLVAESMGADIIRSQAGFKLTEQITRDDLPWATQARDAALSQGKRMIRYSLAISRRLHEILH